MVLIHAQEIPESATFGRHTQQHTHTHEGHAHRHTLKGLLETHVRLAACSVHAVEHLENKAC